MSATKLKVTELDFDQIKSNLVNYFKNVKNDNGESVYSDYDFEGSSLNTLIDILSYNTHYNALLAHTAVNETFIESAQLRSSVVSASKVLGYVPRSVTSPTALVELKLTAKENSADTLFIGKDIRLSTLYNDTSYVFTFDDGVLLNKINGYYVNAIVPLGNETVYNEPVQIRQGQTVTKRYQVNGSDDSQKYIIDDENVDLSTLEVRVYDDSSSANGLIFKRFTNIQLVDGNTRLYFINENFLGLYEISFGNGIFGQKLNHLNVIEVKYLVSDGEAANGANGTFSFIDTNNNIIQNTSATSIKLASPASGGSDRESVERIRQNAPNSFITQNRAVTADDYKNIIYSNFPAARSISVWGGEDNNPPEYGKAFISINKGDESQLTAQDKISILNILRDKKILAISPKIVDSEYITLVLDVLFKYDSNLLAINQSNLEDEVRINVIKKYNDDNLNSFEKIFRYSNLLKSIDTYNAAILNSHVRVFVSKSFTLNAEVQKEVSLNYGTELTIDDDKAIAGYTTDSPWFENGKLVYLADEKHPTDNNLRVIYTYFLTNGIVDRNGTVGFINLKNGTVTLNSFLYSDTDLNFSLDCIPISNDIVPKRNQLITINESRCNVKGFVDEIAVGGSSRAVDYVTFKRDR